MAGRGSAVETAASAPPASPEAPSAPTCSDWLDPSALPWRSAPAASEIIAAIEGRQIASASPQANRVTQSAPSGCGTTTAVRQTASATPKRAVSRRGSSFPESQPTSPRLAITIGTATQAMNSERRETLIPKRSTR